MANPGVLIYFRQASLEILGPELACLGNQALGCIDLIPNVLNCSRAR
jgi:hypothetical protein